MLGFCRAPFLRDGQHDLLLELSTTERFPARRIVPGHAVGHPRAIPELFSCADCGPCTGYLKNKSVKLVRIVVISIEPWISALRVYGAKEVDQYERKLKSFGGHEQKVFEFLSEARAALLFLKNGWQVTMRDRPDLT